MGETRVVNVVDVVGRIVKGSIRREELWYTEVATPSADEYSQPGLLEIRSKAKLGSKDEDLSCLCRVGGYRRKAFKVVDHDSGEERIVRPVQVTLDAV